MKQSFTVLALFLVVQLSCVGSRPFANPDYVPDVDVPHFPSGQGPLVYFDRAHRNVHSTTRTYKPFKDLLEADGYVVMETASLLDQLDLSEVGALVINVPKVYFTQSELAALVEFIDGGGGLFAIGDHADWPLFLTPVTSSFGIQNMNDTARNADGWDFVGSPPEPHYTTAGISQIYSYHGSWVLGGIPILTLGAGAYSEQTGATLAANASRVSVTEFGQGRVYVGAEAKMYSSICSISCEPQLGGGGLSGFDAEGAEENDDHVLRVMLWLTHNEHLEP